MQVLVGGDERGGGGAKGGEIRIEYGYTWSKLVLAVYYLASRMQVLVRGDGRGGGGSKGGEIRIEYGYT